MGKHPDKICYICIVSEQLVPNVIPLLNYNFSPDEVVLIKTDERAGESEKLKNFFIEQHLKVTEILADPMNYSDNAKLVGGLLKDYKDCIDPEFILNITGGTKIMALGVYRSFISENIKKSSVIYVDGIKNKIVKIFPDYEEYSITRNLPLTVYKEIVFNDVFEKIRIIKPDDLTNIKSKPIITTIVWTISNITEDKAEFGLANLQCPVIVFSYRCKLFFLFLHSGKKKINPYYFISETKWVNSNFTKLMILYLHIDKHNISEQYVKRMINYGVRVVFKSEIPNLNKILSDWILN